MIGRETRMLLRHYLEQGASKSALARQLGVSRDTIHRWIRDGELDRDLDTEPVQYGPRRAGPTKLDAYKANAAKPTRAARAAPLARTALPVAAELSESLAALAVLSLLDDDGEEDEEVAEAVLELVVELDDSGSAVVRPPFLRPLPSAGEISRPLILPPLVA